MRYLKSFNESNSDYFIVLTQEEYNNLAEYKYTRLFSKIKDPIISPNEEDQIKSLVGNKYDVEVSSDRYDIYLCKKGRPLSVDYIIEKLTDDWYTICSLLDDVNGYYKCDQIEGVLKCLMAIDNIN